MQEPEKKSPAPKWAKTIAASVFLLIWLAAILVDFFKGGESLVPFWFQATGLIVLGYLLGISFEDAVRGGRS